MMNQVVKLRKYTAGIVFSILGLAGLHPFAAYAQGSCELTPTTQMKNLHSIEIPHNTPVNTVVYSSSFQRRYVATCTSGGYQTYTMLASQYSGKSPKIINGDAVFPTAITGIGVAVRVDGRPLNTNILTNHTEENLQSPDITIKLYKTGNTTSPSQTFSGDLLSYQVNSSAGTKVAGYYSLSGGPLSLTPCSLGYTGTLGVDMGTLFPGTLNGKGNTASPVSFKIPLDCDAGTRLNISFDAASTKGDGIIDLSNSTARGVGIKLMYNDAAVKFGQDTYIQTTQTGGIFNIPLTAAYTQTENDITPGSVSAVANFTVSYE